MALATWWRGDTLPSLSLLAGFRVEASRDEHLIAQINRLALDEVRQRLHTGHQSTRGLLTASDLHSGASDMGSSERSQIRFTGNAGRPALRLGALRQDPLILITRPE